MCGVIGSITNSKLTSSCINELHNMQKHRGPDGTGEYVNLTPSKKVVTLLHQRLSIIDLDDGKQPMSDSLEDITIVYNGEIFNHLELRKDLLRKGYEFSTNHSDTEVLINLYKEYKEKMLTYLNGMFAFVIYDKNNDLLFGARDRAGIKPLYFSNHNNEFYFSSELKTLLKFGIKRDIDLQSLSNYLSFQFTPAPRTIFKGILKLEAGHCFFYDINKAFFKTRKYWTLSFFDKIKSEKEWQYDISSQLKDSVKLWSLSDVEVGVSLSGGLDSSAIVALYSSNNDRKVKTFSLGFEGDIANLDERGLARLVSKKYNTEHFEFVLTEKTLLNELEGMVYHLDEPYAGGLPSWYIYKMMKGQVKVALTGTGGDELFGNYNKAAVYEASILQKFKVFYTQGRGNYKNAFKSFIRYPNGFFYHKYFHGFEIQEVLKEKIFIKPEEYLEKIFVKSNQTDYRNIVPYVDFNMQLPEEFLSATDRFSMAHSIEARTPFLDPKMIDLVMSIPPKMRMKFSDPKYLLRNSIKELLPKELLSTPKKGFVVPQAKWIRTILREKIEYLLGEQYISKQGIFNKSIYTNIIVPHMNGTKDYNVKIWTLFMFQLWYMKFMD